MGTVPMVMDGGTVTSFVRSLYGKHAEWLHDLAQSLPDLTVRQAVALINCRARLEGNTRDGLTYVEEQ